MDASALRGVFPALVTPLTADREVHAADVAALTASAVADGCGGVLVAGSTGEGTLLGRAGRVAVTTAARRGLDGTGRLVLAGASGATVADLHADVAALAEAGADAVLVLAPHTYPLSPEELGDLHVEVADAAPVPTLAYHIPQLTGSSLTADVLAELAAHPRIVGVKDSSPDADRRATFAEAIDDRADFALLTGHAPSIARGLRDGIDGAILAVANLRAHVAVALFDAHRAGDAAAVERHQVALATRAQAMAATAGSTPAVLKAALQLHGRIEERWCRPPLRSLPGPLLDHVRTALLR